MLRMFFGCLSFLLSVFLSFNIYANDIKNPIKIIAAENFYGSIAKQIGGKYVEADSILSNPNADPHLFSTSVKVSKKVTDADIIIYNGVGYDTWMDNLLINNKNNKIIINTSKLLNIKDGSNPHIWYKPETFPILAKYLTNIFIKQDKTHALYFKNNLNKFLNKNKLVQNKIIKIKDKYHGIDVTATEPVFGYMADALGFKMKGIDFQWKIMNDTDPSPKMLLNYENLLINKKVKILFYNNQVSDNLTRNILSISRKNNIPVVGVSEIMYKNKYKYKYKYTDVNDWLINELDKTDKVLNLAINNNKKDNKKG